MTRNPRRRKTKPPLCARARFHCNPRKSAQSAAKKLLLRRLGCFGILAAEALHAAGGVHQLLLAREERMAIRADFYADIALMSRPGHKGIPAGAMHTDFVIRRVNSCFHVA